jgi:NAD(P)-dependent dehydrogenase (short-subunit alcohol dehydrogenase family)
MNWTKPVWWLATLTGLVWGWQLGARRRARIDFQGRVVVITGARGLALVLARQFAREGARLALLARNTEELDNADRELRRLGAEILTLVCDVRERGQVEDAFGRVLQRFGRLDILVNNAGIIQVGPFEHMQMQDYEDALRTHFWGSLYASLAAANIMRAEGSGRSRFRGRIVNITSIGGVIAPPHLLPYVASKFAQVGLSDGLRAELAKDGILVTTVIPGLMRTGSPVNALFKGRHQQEYAWFSIADSLPGLTTSAENAARKILDACRHGDPQLVITLPARLGILANTLTPGLFAGVMKIAGRLLPSPTSEEGDIMRTGWESWSRWSPSPLTVLSDKSAGENNELLGHPTIVEE